MGTIALIGTRIAVATIATDTGTWGNDGGGGGVADEPDIVYQGTTAQSRKVSTSRIGRNYTHGSGSNLANPSNTHYIAKINATNSSALLARTAPAMGVKIGSGSGAHYEYYIYGNDNYPPRGGFQLLAISPRVAAYRDVVTGAPNLGSVLYWSLLADFSASSKSENMVIDAVDLSVGLALTGTSSVFDNFLSNDEETSGNRWGHCSAEGPILLVNGQLRIGQNSSGTSTSTQFSDTTGGTIVWRNGYAETGFHKMLLDLDTAATTFAVDGWTFQGTGSKNNAADRGYTNCDEDTRPQFEVTGTTATATATVDNCTFTDFSKVILNSKIALDATNVECESLVQGSADIERCKITTASVASRATLLDPTFGTTTDLNNTEFVQGGTGHAVQLDDGLGTETVASWQTPGTAAASTGSATVSWPTHATDDIGLLIIETNAFDIPYLSTPAGFERLSSEATGDLTDDTRLTVFWKRAASASETNPVVGDAGDHFIGQILRISGCATTGVPWADVQTRVDTSAGTTVTYPSVTTKADGQLVLGIAVHGRDSAAAWGSGLTNAGLASLTERVDQGTTVGTGGGLYVWTATDTAAGSTGTTTMTASASAPHVTMTLAMRGVATAQARGGYQAAQTVQSGVGAVSVAWPTHATDDVAFLIAETQASETPTLSTPAGFTLVDSVASGTGTRCTIWWHRATSASMTTPTIADAGDHVVATMVTYRNCRTTGNPWDAYATSFDNTTDTTSTFPTVTSQFDGQRIVGVMTQGFDAAGAWGSAHTNASLSSINERFDNAAVDGNGGGINVFDATVTTAGATGTTSVTLANGAQTAAFTFALAAKESSHSLTELTWTGYGADDSTSAALWIPDQGGQYVISVSGGTTPTIATAGAGARTQNTVNLTITVKDPDGNNVEGARVRIQETSGGALVTDGSTNASGVFTDSFNYTSDLGVDVRVRLIGWEPFETSGTIVNTGLALTATLQPDVNVNLP